MLESSFVYFIMRTLPESIILMISGYMLLGVGIKDKLITVIKQGVILGVFIHIVRALPINFGIHTILSMIIQGVMLYIITSKNKGIVPLMVATCQVWLSLILSEVIYATVAINILGQNLQDLTDNQSFDSAIATLPSLAILIMIVFLFRHFNKKTILKG